MQLEEASQVEQTQVAQCRARVEHMGQLAALTASSSGSAGDGEGLPVAPHDQGLAV